MTRRLFTGPVVIALTLLILSRHTTGVPSAQVEIFRNLVVNTQTHTSYKTSPHSSFIKNSRSPELLAMSSTSAQCKKRSTTANRESGSAPKSTYKSYVSPEKTIYNPRLTVLNQSDYHSTSFTQFWIFSTLPQVIHANGPPSFTTPRLYSISTPISIGDRDNSYETKDCSDNRGVCINCIRP